MSRKSLASLSVATEGIPRRISPPEGLTEFQSELWVRVVNTKPIEWFGEDSAPLLVDYVRAVEACDKLEQMVKDALHGGGDDDAKDLFKVLKARDSEVRRMASLAGALRLTQQSRYTPQAAATANKKAQVADKPWQKAA